MKKLVSLALALVCALSLFACTGKTPSEKPSDLTGVTPDPTEISVFAMNGPTGMGMAGLIADAKAGKTADKITFTMADAADEYLADLIAGKFDFACIPTNLAAVLSKKAAGVYEVAAVNTLGVLYLLDRTGATHAAEDLRGKTVFATGEGLVPEIVLSALLKKAGLTVGEDVTVEYLATAADVGAMYLAGTAEIVMLPQPYVTNVMNKLPLDIAAVLDLTAEWDRLFGESSRLMTGCLAVNAKFAAAHPAAVERFLAACAASVEFVNSDSDEAARAVVDAGIVASAELAKTAIPHCNIVFLQGEEMIAALNGFYKEVYALKPALLGGAIPEDGIYYGK